MTETTARIRWTEDAALYVWSGHVGTVSAQLFTIAAPLPGSGKGFLLMSRLPGMDFSCSRPRLEEAQAEAERWLEEFVSSFGAVFPEPPKPDPDCEECGFGLPRHDKDCSYYPGTTAATTAREKE